MNEQDAEIFLKHWGLTVAQAEAQLAALYAVINRSKFKGELPDKVYIRISDQAAGAASANLSSGMGPSIYFHPFLAEVSRYSEIMHHEICHLCAFDGHGPAFQAKLREVGEGEPWLDSQLIQCAQWVRLDKIRLEWKTHGIEVAKLSPGLKWTDARREIVKRLGCKAVDFKEVVWDFKDVWLHSTKWLEERTAGQAVRRAAKATSRK
jgi:hypothetical protein